MKYPWEDKTPERQHQTCQVSRPAWYKNNTMFKPVKDWTDKELADEHEIVRAKIIFEKTKEVV